MGKKYLAFGFAALVALSACGKTPLEQGLMGAGAGVAAATVMGTDAATGAAIGGAANVLYCQNNPGKC